MARRRYQKGTLVLRGTQWVGRWREDQVGLDGKVRRVKRSKVLGDAHKLTRKLAQRILDRELEAINSLDYRPTVTCTFRQFAERWKQAILPQFRPSTQLTMRCHLGTHLIPGLGDCEMGQLGTENIQRFIASLPVAPQTSSRIFTTLRTMWNSALEWGYASKPIGKVKLAASLSKERPALNAEVVQQLVELAKEPLGGIVWIGFETGLRIGEILGLRYSDFDLDRGLLWVRQSVWHGQTQAPKTRNAIRCLPVSTTLVEYIQQKGVEEPNSLIFHSRTGRPLNQCNLLRREWHPLLDRLGIPRCGFHALRHGNSSWMARHKTHPRIMQERLGHADPRLTLKLYSHVAAEDGREVSEELGRILVPSWSLKKAG